MRTKDSKTKSLLCKQMKEFTNQYCCSKLKVSQQVLKTLQKQNNNLPISNLPTTNYNPSESISLQQYKTLKSMQAEPQKPDTDYQCVICLELPVQSVICANCRQLMCWSHVRELKESRCPYCRVTPFNIRYESQIQKKIEERRKKVDKEKQKMMACKAFKCEFIGSYGDLIVHHGEYHRELTLDEVIHGAPPLKPEKAPNPPPPILPSLPQPPRPTQHDIQMAKSLSQPLAVLLAAGQRQKIPTYAKALAMSLHARTCSNPKCKHVWKGRWGCFIGGEKGGTHFDLTMCERGRQLNQDIGWDYEDPKG